VSALFVRKFDLLRKIRLIEKQFRDTNPPRVANADDAGLGGHVITV
jgi:hypothetical protein